MPSPVGRAEAVMRLILDRLAPRLKRGLHPVDRWRPWFRELQAYHRHLAWPEFWARYADGRVRAKRGERWLGPEGDIADYGCSTLEARLRNYYAQQDYFLYRQSYYHRDRTWFSVLATMPRAGGTFLEYGCGIAPVSAWLTADHQRWWRWGGYPRISRWTWTLVDLPSPAFEYGYWRMRRRGTSAQALGPRELDGALIGDVHPDVRYTTIVCLEVMEHLIDPVVVMHHLIDRLAPGGHLHLNFVKCEPGGLNLESAQRSRGDALALLKALECLRPVTDDGGTGIYRRVR